MLPRAADTDWRAEVITVVDQVDDGSRSINGEPVAAAGDVVVAALKDPQEYGNGKHLIVVWL